MSKSQILEKIRKIKKSRIKYDVLDLAKVKIVTPEIFWNQLETMVELNFENPDIKQIALDEGLSFDVRLPDSVRHTMEIEVFFDEEESIEMIDFDPENNVHDAFYEMLGQSQIRENVALALTYQS